jgi:16S rRNA (cytosine1402-N4)-methyltransferase
MNDTENQALHTPVMLTEAIAGLNIKKGAWYIDATFGRGGHTRKMIDLGANVIGLDHDQEAITFGAEHFAEELQAKQLLLLRHNFANLSKAVSEAKEQLNSPIEIYGVLFDFGTSVDQLTSQDRGFSFTGNGPLDMRMDDRLGVTAAQLLAVLSEAQLSETFRNYGGEEAARAIAKAIVAERSRQPIETTQQLVQLISKIKRRRDRIHPATKVFQALRMVVNSEIDNIEQGLPQALQVLAKQGVIVTIAFHEGEDRIVKHTFKKWALEEKGTAYPLIKPSVEEINTNPPSRSAKLRIFEKK